MGIGVDAEETAERQRPLVPAPVEVGPPRMRIALRRHAMRRTGFENRLDVDLIARALQQPPPRRMAQDGGPRMADGADDAPGLGRAIELEPAMHARHHEIEAR